MRCQNRENTQTQRHNKYFKSSCELPPILGICDIQYRQGHRLNRNKQTAFLLFLYIFLVRVMIKTITVTIAHARRGLIKLIGSNSTIHAVYPHNPEVFVRCRKQCHVNVQGALISITALIRLGLPSADQ